MRRVTLASVSVVLAMVIAGGVALAANEIKCQNGDGGRCIGTAGADEMAGSRNDDAIRGRGGADIIKGCGGSDEIHGELGRDRIVATRCALPGGAEVLGPLQLSDGSGRRLCAQAPTDAR